MAAFWNTEQWLMIINGKLKINKLLLRFYIQCVQLVL